MRRPWLIVGLVIILNACSNATFKGVKGDSSRDETPPVNNEEANPIPPTDKPNTPDPNTDDPNTQNPGPEPGPCDPLTLLDLDSLYQLKDDVCNPDDPEDDDDDEDPDDDPDDDPEDDPDDDPEDDPDDDPGQNEPGQNS
ncbi:hypothetical protein [Oligoflexus tunisiensis]|uniref:hypothetical protein n=1 Tax=Oligoflexus tunisiensis TaxID=708132 RepID=UPI000ACA7DA2|nr:hypothetical protein [Oligoflexus tunisiensis]